MSRILSAVTFVFAVILIAAPSFGTLSGNLMINGDFESTANLKNADTLDAESTLIPLHRFNQDTDLGWWLAKWGPPSISSYAGIGVYDDPRDVGETGGITQTTGDIGDMNRSVDPLNPGNHVMDTALFRPRWGQWVAGPENQIPGPITFSFDFYIEHWMTGSAESTWVSLYGLNFLPDHDESYCVDNEAGNALTPLGQFNDTFIDATSGAPLDGDLLMHMRFGWWHDVEPSNPEKPDFRDNFGIWNTITNDPGNDFWQSHAQNVVTTDLTETYDYYAFIVYSVAYNETHDYHWLENDRVTDLATLMYDNISLQVSLLQAGIRCDFDGDGITNLLDINPFVLAITNLPQYVIDYPHVNLLAADPNLDGLINLLDIPPFVACITGGGATCGDGSVTNIPEPASVGLIVLGSLALLRRRNMA